MKYILSSESWFSLSCYEGKILGPHKSSIDLPMSVVSFSDWKDVEQKKNIVFYVKQPFATHQLKQNLGGQRWVPDGNWNNLLSFPFTNQANLGLISRGCFCRGQLSKEYSKF